MTNLNFLLHETFRSNPTFELLEWGNISQSGQETLTGLFNNPDIFGLFQQKNVLGEATTKIAYKEVALLFYVLQKPGKLPQYFKNVFDDDVNTTLAKLILEGIFEIGYNHQFVSGAAAQPVLYKSNIDTTKSNKSFLTKLSSKAIEYGLQLINAETSSLTSKLYCYNTAPQLPQPENAFDGLNEIEHFLGIGKKDSFRWKMMDTWDRHEPSEKYKWLSWTRKQHKYHTSSTGYTYKIYISPVLSAFPKVFNKSVYALSQSKSFSFKIGINRSGLLRPDKFVAYFYEYEHLMEAAKYLKETLAGHEAQGVPFTAAIDDSGMLSWGVDPPNKEVFEHEGGSWRAAIAEKLAVAITQSKKEKLTKTGASEFVMNKVSLEGIDPFNWTPIQKNLFQNQ